MRSSDLGGPSEFPKADNTVHGIMTPIDRPLDLRNFVDKKQKAILSNKKSKGNTASLVLSLLSLLLGIF